MMRMAQGQISVATRGQGLYEVTAELSQWLAKQSVQAGLLTLFVRHTSASLLVQENAASDVRADLNDFFRRLVPEDLSLYRHDEEGADDMPGHIGAVLCRPRSRYLVATASSCSVHGRACYFSSIAISHTRERSLSISSANEVAMLHQTDDSFF